MGLENNRIVDPVLTALAQGFDPLAQGLVGSALFPWAKVEKEAGKIPTFGKEAFRPVATERAIRADSNRLQPDKTGNISFVMDEHDLYEPVDIRESAEDVFNLEQIRANEVRGVILLNHERECATLATTASNYATGSKEILSGGGKWDQSTSTPISDVKDAKEAIRKKIGVRPNTLVLSASSYEALCEHASIIDRIKYSQTGVVTMDLLKSLFGIQNVMVADAVTLAKTGSNFNDIWGDNAVLAYIKNGPNNSPFEQNFGWSIGKKGYPQADTFPLNPGKTKGVRVTDFWDVLMTNAEAGFLIGGTRT